MQGNTSPEHDNLLFCDGVGNKHLISRFFDGLNGPLAGFSWSPSLPDVGVLACQWLPTQPSTQQYRIKEEETNLRPDLGGSLA